VPSRAAIYARYSTDRQDARSIEDQLRRCRRFAEERGYEVVSELSDAAQSGATLDRDGMQQLLARARSRPVPFEAVLVDDLSRLSRDLGNTWRIVFEDLASARVRVVDCTTGMASDGAGARLTFGAMALVNDTFLQLVRTETHRGLEGRALAGFHTGGRCFGYTTTPEPTPVDPEHPRAVVRIQPDEARVVRQVFERYAAGEPAARIAAALNAAGVPAPYDRLGYEKRAGKGWATNQVQNLLRNERYIGRIVWNKREFFRDPMTKKRRARMRPEADWVVQEAPELAIVPRELWEAAQELHRTHRPGGQVNGKRTTRLLAGLLRCGVCGSAMAISDITKRGGEAYARYRCSANKGKGDTVCPNRARVSERRVNAMVLEGLEGYLQSDGFQGWLDASLVAAERARARRGGVQETDLEAEVRGLEGRVERLVTAITETGVSESLRAALVREEDRLRDARKRLAEVRRPKVVRLALDLSCAAEAVREIAQLAAADVAAARARLTPYLDHVVLSPDAEGYSAEVVLRNTTAALVGGRSVPSLADGYGCGGRIEEPSATSNPRFPGRIPKRSAG
jgi:DNA invertase Pin-like site-specific DNA recombinase